MSNSHIKYLLGLPFSHRQSRLAQARRPLTETEFVQQITDQAGDRDAAVAVWKRLKDWGYQESFTPYPTDSLGSVFGIAEEEKDEDLILSILKELDIPVPSQQTIESFGAVQSPLQVAKFVAFCRMQGGR